MITTPSLRDSLQPARSNSLADIDWDIMKMLKFYWPIGLVCVLLGWAGAIFYYLKTPPIYESTAEILLMPKDPALAARGLEGGHDANATLSNDLLATHVMLIKSPAIVEEALKRKDLTNLPSLVEAMLPNDNSTADPVIRSLTVSRGGKGEAEEAQVLNVSFEHTNAEDAKLVVEAIVDEFRDFINKKYADVNQTAAELIQKAQTQLKTDLETVEKKYREFSQKAPILVGAENSTNVYRAEYEQFETKLTDVRMERADRESRLKLVEEQLELIQESNGNSFEKLALIGDESAERIKVFLEVLAGRQDSLKFMAQQPERAEVARGEYEELLKLKARLKSLVEDFGPEHAEVRNVSGQIETVESFIASRSDKLQVQEREDELTADAIIKAYVSLLRHDIRAFQAREVLLLKGSKEAESKAKSLIELELEGEALRLAVERQKDLFNATVERLHEINLARDYGGFVNETIKKPMTGTEVWPKLPKCAAFGTLAGLVIACGIAVIMELQNRSLRSVQDVEEITGVPTISLIPKLTEHLDAEFQQKLKDTKNGVEPTLVSYHHPNSREAEVFRGLRTTLLFKANAAKAKVISVTSPSAGDGKSTVLLNIAMSLAHAGRRVLLIDADMRRPTVASKLGLTNNVGLSELLQGETILLDAVVPSPKANLDVLLAGRTPDNPSELLSSPEFKALIESARAEYDIVLIDCPPVLAVADPCIVATSVDAMLLVLRVNAKSKVELQRTMTLINEVKGNVLGTVVNASKLLTAEGELAGDYGVGYGYGSYGGKAGEYFRNVPSATTPTAKPPVPSSNGSSHS